MARRPSSLPRLYTVSAPVGVGFESGEGRGFFVKTLFVESALERARQEFASGRPVVSAALYESGKVVRIVDADDFREHKAGCGCVHCYGDEGQ
jgi:hypothetical protein